MGKFAGVLVTIAAFVNVQAEYGDGQANYDRSGMTREAFVAWCDFGEDVEFEPSCLTPNNNLVGCVDGTTCRICGGDPQTQIPCKVKRGEMKAALPDIDPWEMNQAQLRVKCETTPNHAVEWFPRCKARLDVGCFLGGVHQECREVQTEAQTDQLSMNKAQFVQFCGHGDNVEWEPRCSTLNNLIGCIHGTVCRICGGDPQSQVPCKAKRNEMKAAMSTISHHKMTQTQLRIICETTPANIIVWNAVCAYRTEPGCFFGGVHHECQDFRSKEKYSAEPSKVATP